MDSVGAVRGLPTASTSLHPAVLAVSAPPKNVIVTGVGLVPSSFSKYGITAWLTPTV